MSPKRIHELDALRGIALLGILIVNILVFHAPYAYYGEVYGQLEGLESTVVDLVVHYAGGKFLFIFAFLFGYGISMQQHSHGANFSRYFTRRMGELALFGALHILLFWFGDILLSYALLGLMTLPFLRLSNSNILVAGLFFVLFRPLYYVAVLTFGLPLMGGEAPETLEVFYQTFQEGSYLEILSLRMQEFTWFIPENLVWYIPKTWGLFFFGIYAHRTGILGRFSKAHSFSLLWILFLLGQSVLWNTYKMDWFATFDLAAQPWWRPILIAVNVTSETLQGLGYIFSLTLLFHLSPNFTTSFAPIGRMALTNYIMQSLICVLLFYGFGFGLYGTLKPSQLMLIAAGIYSLNIIASHAILSRYSSGPLEYLWRKMIRK